MNYEIQFTHTHTHTHIQHLKSLDIIHKAKRVLCLMGKVQDQSVHPSKFYLLKHLIVLIKFHMECLHEKLSSKFHFGRNLFFNISTLYKEVNSSSCT